MTEIRSRRFLLRSAVLAGLTLVISSAALATEPTSTDRFKTQLGKAKAITAETMESGNLPVNISPDGLASTILLDDLAVSIDGDAEAHSATKVAILEIPVTVPDLKEENFLGYHALLGGTVTKGEGTRVQISLDLGGTHHAVEFPFGKSFDGTIKPESYFAYSLSELKQADGPDGQRTLVGIPAPPHYTAIIVLSIQRRTPEDTASVEISSFDVEIIRPRKGPQGSSDNGSEDQSSKKNDAKKHRE
ncbi:MAG: hypothetical protein WD049_01935 [Candidatus Paceibacterota bacterium]